MKVKIKDLRLADVVRIGHTTYVKLGNIVGEIKGPYKPGGVWKVEVYKIKPEFDQAWEERKITPIQRGKVSTSQDRVIAALTWGQSNPIDPDLYTGIPFCLGYKYKSKTDAIKALYDFTKTNR